MAILFFFLPYAKAIPLSPYKTHSSLEYAFQYVILIIPMIPTILLRHIKAAMISSNLVFVPRVPVNISNALVLKTSCLLHARYVLLSSGRAWSGAK